MEARERLAQVDRLHVSSSSLLPSFVWRSWTCLAPFGRIIIDISVRSWRTPRRTDPGGNPLILHHRYR
jgi:hypothetical protein